MPPKKLGRCATFVPHRSVASVHQNGPPPARKQESLYRREIAPHEKKLVWYRFIKKLPEVLRKFLTDLKSQYFLTYTPDNLTLTGNKAQQCFDSAYDLDVNFDSIVTRELPKRRRSSRNCRTCS